MTKFVRLAALAAATALAAAPAVAAGPVSADPKAKASARIVKPLTLTAERDLDFGTIVNGLTAGTRVISISQGGVVTGCDGVDVVCSGTPTSAQYNVTGTNAMTVNIAVTDSTLTNMTSGGTETLAFTPNAPTSILLTNSGAPGEFFEVGGSITIADTTVGGLYEGEIEVTVDY